MADEQEAHALKEDNLPKKDDTVCTFFKKSTKNKNMRKRMAKEDVDEEAPTLVHRKSIRRNEGALEFSTGSSQKQHATDEKSLNEEAKAGNFFYESSRQLQTETDSRATAINETETEIDRDARAIRERVLKQAEESLKGEGASDSKVYKGIHGYTDHKAGFRREHTIAGEKAGGAHGPLRASAHIRWSVRFDYQPDICKDYKETGYCGYGDACKFMHDRGDYKSGWQMEREWEEAEKKKKARLAQGIEEGTEGEESEERDDDDLPFACYKCRQPFTNPVVTICKHYFCESCALKHHTKNKKCYVCNKPTNGVFNTAHEILKKMEAAKASGRGKEALH
ncbi:hypothetical protein O6H91_20G027400 [Diphasiastrum complanatum]|uniref:Uncharacterized protein n=1 Tax=Diphasiastrum complanatum TaxID=34168 RepID=A0ACC2ANL3_DIPCM|nr:hypothetical protein O6H91_Y277500 [Diphasiastrum complanatum]KAJ7298354.1 hypothetical protein O6H91_Y002600 [Diphasiastrum complanatum]KAJ7519193.1 hypothetical protein O6H91_20G027400 [Diphasiastrum complanatum]